MVEEERDPLSSILRNKRVVYALIVVLIIILAAFLFILPEGNDYEHYCGIRLSQFSKSSDTVVLEVMTVPTGAKIDGTIISYTQYGTPVAIDLAKIYDENMTQVALWNGTWDYLNGYSVDDAEFDVGCKIIITVDNGLGTGDQIVFTSRESYYGTTIFTIQ